MELNPLSAISPVDGRYRNKTTELATYFSEFAWIHYRVQIEVEYFIRLCALNLPRLSPLNEDQIVQLRQVYQSFSPEDAQKIKDIERVTNHDVKAVEYFLKEKLRAMHLEEHQEFVHFALTSQDINNTAVPLLLKDALENVYHPLMQEVLVTLHQLAQDWKDIPMLARTHGQAASPTRLGKELLVFYLRLEEPFKALGDIRHRAKFGGATGNFNAHYVAYPQVDWIRFADEFVASLGLVRNPITTQIEPYDDLGALLDTIRRINTTLIDFCQDIWHYISIDYFKQKVQANEVGSSTMPHKVNPIDFENAEGNLGLANALFSHLANKLPISRLQRDLTDSTVLRNLGVPFAHTLIALRSLLKGLGKLELNPQALEQDLDKNWAVVAEAIQTILRREGYPNPYEALKSLTRGNQKITQSILIEFINQLEIKEELKQELQAITPFNYLGIQLM